MCPAQQEQLGTLLSRGACEWPFCMGMKWPERDRGCGEEAVGKEGMREWREAGCRAVGG